MSKVGRLLLESRLAGYINSLFVADRYDGHIDDSRNGEVRGWIKRINDPKPLEIDLYANGTCVRSQEPADRQRPDLVDAGSRTGRHGFLFALPAGLEAGGEVEVEVRISSTGEAVLRRLLKVGTGPAEQAVGPTAPAIEPGAQPDPGLVQVGTTEEQVAEPPVPPSAYRAYLDQVTPDLVAGWAVDASDPGRIFEVDLLIDGVPFASVLNDRSRGDLRTAGLSAGLGGIQAEVPLARLEAGEHEVELRLPNGKSVSKTIAVEGLRPSRPPSGRPIPAGNVSIIVPVFNAADDLAVCIERLRDCTPPWADILFIDDASTDDRIQGLLAEAVAGHANMRALRNDRNLGFTSTVNRGISEAGRHDVVLLNSDARVTPGWLQGLLAAAQSGPRIATVTPMSDRAGAFSAPDIGNHNPLPPGVDEVTYARAFRLRSLGLYPEVPTGNGFCMFVSRACLDEVGALDADAFPRGYGEENDFCMRAGRAGWRHLVDDRTYVFHDRSKSFGSEKGGLLAAGRAVVDGRYPEYKTAIRAFRSSPKLQLARHRARAALQDCGELSATRPRVLFVISTQTGGTPQTNLDLMSAFGDALDCWVLRCDSRMVELSRLRGSELRLVRRHKFDDAIDPLRHASTEYDAVVADWLASLGAELLHVRHLAWHSLSLPRLAKAAGMSVVFSFHDFYALCPTVKLVNHEGTFCGGRCTSTEGLCRPPQLWPAGSLPALDQGWIRFWRERFGQVLAECDAFVTTSESARDRLLEHLPGLPAERFEVIPHGRDFPGFSRLRQTPEHGRPLRILVPGNLDATKGLKVIDALLAHDAAGLLEFHVLGAVAPDQHVPHPRLVLHGPYGRDQFADKAAKVGAHLGAILSIWDETYCHTLTELWSVGLPAAVLDFPTIAARVRRSGAGWVLSHRDVPALYAELLRVGFDPVEQHRTDAALLDWQIGRGLATSTRDMAARYLEVYRQAIRHHRGRPGDARVPPVGLAEALAAPALGHGRAPRVGVVCPSDRSLATANASTHVRIWERTRNHPDREVTFVRLTPAGLSANLRAGALDAAILQRNAVPVSLGPQLRDDFAAARVPYLFDLDDDLLKVPPEKDPRGTYAAYAPILRMLVEGAAVVTVSTPALLSTYRALNARAVLLPNRLSRSLWAGAVPERAAGGTVCALYMGTLTHEEDFALVRPALRAAVRRHPNFRVAVIGVSDAELPKWAKRITVPNEAKSYSRFVPWLRGQAAQFDFGIAPLARTTFNASKSDLKVLDYGALGLPALVSEGPAYDELARIAPSVTRVANTIEAWTGALDDQIVLGPGNQVRGAELRSWIFEHRMLEPTLAEFDGLLLSMIGDGMQAQGVVADLAFERPVRLTRAG